MTAADLFVSVVAPLHDDADIAAAFVDEVVAVLRQHYLHYELILVDDGSTDDTVRVVDQLLARHEAVRLIRLSRHFGTEIAISAGLDSAIGDFVGVMLPETDPPALLPAMVEQSRQGAGVVFGIRRDRKGERALLRLATAAFYWLCNRVLDLHLPRNSTHFRVLSRQAVNAVVRIRDRNRYLRTLSAFVGYSNQSLVYDTVRRRARPRTKSLAAGLRLALGIIVANSLQPLYLAAMVGLAAVLASALFLVYAVAIYLFKPHVAEGWTTQALVAAAMFGSISLICTILAAYLARLLDENQDRPLYFVRDERQGAGNAPERTNVVTDPVGR